jgi:hypothetical protein
MGAQSEEPAKDVGDVAPEDAAVGVELIDDDDPELLEQLEPLRVVREDGGVEHVRVCHDHLARGPDGRPDGCRSVAVVRGGRDIQFRRPGEGGELCDLVMAERLGREQEERPGRRIVRDGLQDRERVAQRLARCGRRDDDDVISGPDGLDRLCLVDIELLDPTRQESPADPRVDPLG